MSVPARERAVTLQVNLAPPDLGHVEEILPHQLRQWAGQVDEVLFTLDVEPPQGGGRFGAGWDENRPRLEALVSELSRGWPGARASRVDHSEEAVLEVGRAFFGGARVPFKDYRGGPFYSYFHGLHQARNDLVLHTDSDMLFGGGSQSWTAEAARLLSARRDVVACSPLPGPPTADGSLVSQQARREEHPSVAYRFDGLSTRVFLLDRARLRDRVGALKLAPPSRLQSKLKALVLRNSSYAFAEHILTAAMRRHGLVRVDFLGADPGMWSLHPTWRSERFYRELPRLVRRVEEGDMPQAQRGDSDINRSLLDWSGARGRGPRNWRR